MEGKETIEDSRDKSFVDRFKDPTLNVLSIIASLQVQTNQYGGMEEKIQGRSDAYDLLNSASYRSRHDARIWSVFRQSFYKRSDPVDVTFRSRFLFGEPESNFEENVARSGSW